MEGPRQGRSRERNSSAASGQVLIPLRGSHHRIFGLLCRHWKPPRWEKLTVRCPQARGPQTCWNQRLKMLTPTYLTTSQRKVHEWIALSSSLSLFDYKAPHYPLWVRTQPAEAPWPGKAIRLFFLLHPGLWELIQCWGTEVQAWKERFWPKRPGGASPPKWVLWFGGSAQRIFPHPWSQVRVQTQMQSPGITTQKPAGWAPPAPTGRVTAPVPGGQVSGEGNQTRWFCKYMKEGHWTSRGNFFPGGAHSTSSVWVKSVQTITASEGGQVEELTDESREGKSFRENENPGPCEHLKTPK